ncbi:hypothetical protein DTO027B5_3342 [Paecilomyces variotii]|nr:hypothetical protein DTO032I3_2202 [Paecilomyces variotii]KAJ9262451.1 hypothetical protein DTO195F2_3499 [Paecilomyces variotii]KAJ9280778.1 hypothetical protein DTO021D3_2248 [Paecilomyces variotii]KAJ9324907.1 hypothetical protein DTO027B3_4039 [Paecilomyces variotii]KAJ9334836.1 hypothetical protein DTO027B5_3342 [Paecilomyces variotii]
MPSLTPEQIQYQMSHKDDDRRAGIVASISIMLVVAYGAVILRVVARRIGRVPLKMDDWMIMVGLFLTTCFAIGCFLSVALGMGRHAIMVKQPTRMAKQILTNEVFYTPTSTTVKFSILLFYRRLFPLQNGFNWTLLGVAVSTLGSSSSSDAKCDNYSPALLLFAIVNASTDVFILCIPLPILWKLRVSATRRKQLIGIFLLGGLVCVVSICRVGYVIQVTLTDPSWDDVNTVILSAVENCAGVLSACLPTTLPIWRYLRHGKASQEEPGHHLQESENPRKKPSCKKNWYTDTMLLNSIAKDDIISDSNPSSEHTQSTVKLFNPASAIRVTTDFQQEDEIVSERLPSYQPYESVSQRCYLTFDSFSRSFEMLNLSDDRYSIDVLLAVLQGLNVLGRM